MHSTANNVANGSHNRFMLNIHLNSTKITVNNNLENMSVILKVAISIFDNFTFRVRKKFVAPKMQHGTTSPPFANPGNV